MKFDIQNRENMLILNITLRIDDLVRNFGHPIDVLSNLMKFGAKNKWNILTDIHCQESGQISFYALLLFIRLEIEIAVKSQRTVRKLRK